MLFLTYIILIVFTDVTDDEMKYIGSFITAGLVLLVIAVNVLQI